MPQPSTPPSPYPSISYREELIAHGILTPMGVDGLYARSAAYEGVIERLHARISELGRDLSPEVMHFPPALSQADFETSGYFKNFPHFAGSIHCFCGDERQHQEQVQRQERGEDWTAAQQISGLIMTPAACYPCYSIVAKRGPLRQEGHTVELSADCFRHEPSLDPARMQLFRMREIVRLGTPEQVLAFRELWLQRGPRFIEALGLPAKLEVANDPFFGRAGKLIADNQTAQQLKFELVIPVADENSPTACLSFNYHMDHFGETWNIFTEAGERAHTACVAFGMDRLALALFRHHGFDPTAWPSSVRAALDATVPTVSSAAVA